MKVVNYLFDRISYFREVGLIRNKTIKSLNENIFNFRLVRKDRMFTFALQLFRMALKEEM